MAKKKGMSMEEKAVVMLSIFHETKDVMNFKEVEKLSLKKGIGKIISLPKHQGNTGFAGRRRQSQ